MKKTHNKRTMRKDDSPKDELMLVQNSSKKLKNSSHKKKGKLEKKNKSNIQEFSDVEDAIQCRKVFLKDKLKSKSLYSGENFYILNTDFLHLDELHNEIDLIVTSPPYNLDIKYKSNDDKLMYSEYLEFTHAWLKKCFDLAKDDGRLCLNIPLDKNKNGMQSIYVDITSIAKEVGWQYFTSIVWNEGNISRRTAWGSWLSASAPFVIAPVEMIVVFYKKQWKKINKGISTIDRDEFINWTNGLWTFNGESKKRIGHPAPFPLELPNRCIKLFSYRGDVVMDPFLGSGTTAISALANDRVCIGVDIDTSYCDLAAVRLKKFGDELNDKKNQPEQLNFKIF